MFEFIGTHHEYFLLLIILSIIILFIIIGMIIKTKLKSLLSKILMIILVVLLVLSLGAIYKARSAANDALKRAQYHTLTIKDIQSKKYKKNQFYYKLNTVELGPNITTTSSHRLKPNDEIAYKKVHDSIYINGNKIKVDKSHSDVIKSKNIKNITQILMNQKFILDKKINNNQFEIIVQLYKNNKIVDKLELNRFYEVKNSDEINLIQLKQNDHKINQLQTILDDIIKHQDIDQFKIIVKQK